LYVNILLDFFGVNFKKKQNQLFEVVPDYEPLDNQLQVMPILFWQLPEYFGFSFVSK
jgi:hypothetical protein